MIGEMLLRRDEKLFVHLGPESVSLLSDTLIGSTDTLKYAHEMKKSVSSGCWEVSHRQQKSFREGPSSSYFGERT
jgi:hypothetical protein